MKTESPLPVKNGHATLDGGAVPVQSSDVMSPHDRIPFRRDAKGNPLPETLIIGGMLAARQPLERSAFQKILLAAPDDVARARLELTYELVHDSYLRLVEAEIKLNDSAKGREAYFRRTESEVRAEVTRLQQEMQTATAPLREQLEAAEVVYHQRRDAAVSALSVAGAADPHDLVNAPSLLLPESKTVAQAHETLAISSPHLAQKYFWPKVISVAACFILGPFAGIGFFAKLGFMSRSVVSSTDSLFANAFTVGWAALLGAIFFLIGGTAVELSFKKAASLSATGALRAKTALGYALAGLLFVIVLALDTTLQHEGIRVLAIRAAGEEVAHGLSPIYLVMGATLILGLLAAKAYLGNLTGLALRHATKATAWIDDERDADRLRRRNSGAIQSALDLASQARVQEAEVGRIQRLISEVEAPFRREIGIQESRRVNFVPGWTAEERFVYKELRQEWEVNSVRLETLIDCYLGDPLARLGFWRRLRRLLGLEGPGKQTPRRQGGSS